MVALLLLLNLAALGAICWNLRQIGEALTIIAAASQIETMKKAGVVDEIREAVIRRAAEQRAT